MWVAKIIGYIIDIVQIEPGMHSLHMYSSLDL